MGLKGTWKIETCPDLNLKNKKYMNKNSKQRVRKIRKAKQHFHGKPCYTFFDGREKYNPENKRTRAANYPKR